MDARDYAAVYVEQHGRCALCGAYKAPAGTDALVVDADADLGGIRSLLCKKCHHVSTMYDRILIYRINNILNSGYRCDGTMPMVRYVRRGMRSGRPIVCRTLTETQPVGYRGQPNRVKNPYIGVDGKEHIRKGV